MISLVYNINEQDKICYLGSPISELYDLPKRYQISVCKSLNNAHINGQINLQEELKELLGLHGILT